jgi:hypothetical protein
MLRDHREHRKKFCRREKRREKSYARHAPDRTPPRDAVTRIERRPKNDSQRVVEGERGENEHRVRRGICSTGEEHPTERESADDSPAPRSKSIFVTEDHPRQQLEAEHVDPAKFQHEKESARRREDHRARCSSRRRGRVTARELVRAFQSEQQKKQNREAPTRARSVNQAQPKIGRERSVLRIRGEGNAAAVVRIPRRNLVIVSDRNASRVVVRVKIMLVVVVGDLERMREQMRDERGAHHQPQNQTQTEQRKNAVGDSPNAGRFHR